MTRIRADDANHALATNNLAVAAQPLDRSLDSHFIAPNIFYYFVRNTIRALLKSYGVSCTVTLSPGRIRM